MFYASIKIALIPASRKQRPALNVPVVVHTVSQLSGISKNSQNQTSALHILQTFWREMYKRGRSENW